MIDDVVAALRTWGRWLDDLLVHWRPTSLTRNCATAAIYTCHKIFRALPIHTCSSFDRAQEVYAWLKHLLPFLALLFLLFMYHHYVGVLQFAWLTFCISHLNHQLKLYILDNRPSHAGFQVVRWAMFLLAHAVPVLPFAPLGQLLRVVALLPVRPVPGLWDAFYLTVVGDCLVRLASLMPNMVLVCYLQVGAFLGGTKTESPARTTATHVHLFEVVFLNVLHVAISWHTLLANPVSVR